MERMLVVVFDSENQGLRGQVGPEPTGTGSNITTYAGAIVVKHADGTASVKQADEFGPSARWSGPSVGSLIGLLGGPADSPIGAASGLALARFFVVDDLRVGGDFVDDVTKALTPNKVALIARSRRNGRRPVDTRMERWAAPCSAARCRTCGRTSTRRTSRR